MVGITLTDRQLRERAYHRDHAAEWATMVEEPLPMDLIASAKRRWWNHYWDMYSHFQTEDLAGRHVLVDGCGFGHDALALAHRGAIVTGNDLSPESIDICKARATYLGLANVRFDVAPCETLPYADASFDVLLFYDILHHVDIPAAMAEARRVLKPGGKIIIGEPYTHRAVQKILRENVLVRKIIYPLMTKFIYQTDKLYITDDERKLDHQELDFLRAQINIRKMDYFYILLTRVVPDRFTWFARLDKLLCRFIGPLGRYCAGRFFMTGTIKNIPR